MLLNIHNHFYLLFNPMEGANQGQPNEKIMTALHRSYAHAINILKTGRLNEGSEALIQILRNEYMHDTDMENLKYSALMSLAQVNEALHQPLTALGFYWQSLQILSHRSSVNLQKGHMTLRQVNDQRADEEFTLVMKMVLIVEKMNMPEQTIYLLKRVIGISPSIWRERLLLKLERLYEREGKIESLLDLRRLLSNKDEMENVLTEKWRSQSDEQKSNQADQLQSMAQSTCSLPRLSMTINLDQKEDQLLKYSCWQILLSVCYTLLKCQSVRNFSKKKYLHKKYEQNNKEWSRFIRDFSPVGTSIEIVLVNEGVERMQIEGEVQDQGAMVAEFASQLLRCQYVKKKSKKAINPLQQLSRTPSLSAKDAKKQTTQTKSVFASIYDYYKETMTKNGFRRQLLNCINFFDHKKFQDIFGRLLIDEIVLPQQKEGDENDDDEGEGSLTVIHGVQQSGKQPTKQKISAKNRKLLAVAHHRTLNQQLPLFLQSIEGNAGRFVFNNVMQMIEKITYGLVKQKRETKESKQEAILNYSAIRKALEKNILKIIQIGDGFFSQYTEYHQKIDRNWEERIIFLQILLQKMDQLMDKDCKNKLFKTHQQTKRCILFNYIKQHFSITPYCVQQIQSQRLQSNYLTALASQSLGLLRLTASYSSTSTKEIAYYKQLFIMLKKREELQGETLIKEVGLQAERRITSYADKQIQRLIKKAASRASLLVISEQHEESTANTFDQIFKRDQDISLALPLLRIFNCLTADQPKAKGSEVVQELNGRTYLVSFIRLAEIFFKKIEIQSQKQFNSRLLILVSEILRIKQVIVEIYQKFLPSSAIKTNQIESSVLVETMFYLLRFYLLNLYEDNDNCIRIIFYISSLLFRSYPDEVKYLAVPQCIYLYDELIKFKKFKPELLGVVRKKFYHNLILKNLVYIYQSPIFAIVEEQYIKKKAKSSSSNEQDENKQQNNKNGPDQHHHLEIRERVYDILHDIYFCPDKQKQFNPKKIEEAVGYFMYLSRANHQEFQCKEVELVPQVCRIIKKCYKIYLQKRSEVYQYCEAFNNFRTLFETLMKKDQNQANIDHLQKIVKREVKICECCTSLPLTHQFYYQTLFILGKYFEAMSSQQALFPQKQQWLKDLDKDQKYYLQYLSLDFSNESAWKNLIRVNSNKAYYYFDSFLGEPFELYKQKFLYTKSIIILVIEKLPQMKQLTEYSNSCLEILNTLKIKEREYHMVLKEIESMGNSSKESKESSKKYKEGLKKVVLKQGRSFSNDVRVRYLRVVELKMKVVWINIEKELRQDDKNDGAIIELDEQSNDAKVTHKPSKNVLQVAQIMDQIKQIIKDLPMQQKHDYVVHLEEDLVMEAYVFLSRHLEWKLEKAVNKICEAISTSLEIERMKRIQEAEYFLSDLRYTLDFFKDGHFLTVNQKYRLKDQKLLIQQSDFANLQILIDSVFNQIKESGMKKLEATVREMVNKKHSIIIINDQPQIIQAMQKQQDPSRRPLIEQKMEQQKDQHNSSESKRSKSQGSNSSKDLPKNKQIPIDLGRFVCARLRQQVNQAQNCSLADIQILLNSLSFQENILKMTKIMQQLVRIFISLPKFQIKKFKNRRSVTMSLLYCSHLTLRYSMQPDRAYDLIREYYSVKSDELVSINMCNQKLATEKNELLSEFYNRVIVHQIMKIRFIQHIFDIYTEQGNKEGLVILNRKLLKLSKGVENPVWGKNSEKDKEKQKAKANKPVVVVQEENVERQKEENQIKQIKQIKDNKEMKELKDAKDVNKDQKEKQIRCYFLLFCEGASKFVDIVKKESEEKQLEQKYQKNLLQFKNRIKKSMGKDENNPYFNKIDQFLIDYERKYGKKIKMKKSKKEKEGESLPKLDFPISLPLPILKDLKMLLDLPHKHEKIEKARAAEKIQIERVEQIKIVEEVVVDKSGDGEKSPSSQEKKQQTPALRKTKRVIKRKQIKDHSQEKRFKVPEKLTPRKSGLKK